MRVHHINCGTMCPYGGRLITGQGGFLGTGNMVCHCLLVETESGLILVDTGIGLADIADVKGRMGGHFATLARPKIAPEECAKSQVERLGFKASDVRHIVVTHLDLDHAGGLADFPEAKVHVFATEHGAAMHPQTKTESMRYRPCHWAHGPSWVLHDAGAGERWFGFDAVRAIDGAPPEVLLVPLHGHSRGHCGVAVHAAAGWLLHCGDAYFHHGEMDAASPRCPLGLELFQRIAATDGHERRQNQTRLRDLAKNHAREVRLFSAHSPVEFDRLRG